MYRCVKNIGKTFLILPIALYSFLPQMGIGRIDTSVTELLIGTIFGRITDGDSSNLVIVVGKLAYLLLFHLLFGTYISKYFTYMPSYYFSRISNRCAWFGKQCFFLLCFALWYALLFLGSSFWGCCMISSEKPDQESWYCFFIMFVVCVSLLWLTTLIINLGIIVWKTGRGFSGCWIGIILLELIAKETFHNPWISFMNPMSYFDVLHMSFGQVLLKILYLFLLAIIVAVCGTVFFHKYDITLREVD